MTDEKRKEKELPKTWSADHSGGVTAPARNTRGKDTGPGVRDEGIRPEDLNSENDQGAS